MDKADVLVPDDLDLIDRTEPAEVVSQRLLGDGLVEVAEVDVSRRAVLLDGQHDGRRDRARLAPPDLEFLAVELDLSHERVGVESGGGGRVDEGDEGAALLGEDFDVVDGTEADLAEELIDRGFGRKAADVDGSAGLDAGVRLCYGVVAACSTASARFVECKMRWAHLEVRDPSSAASASRSEQRCYRRSADLRSCLDSAQAKESWQSWPSWAKGSRRAWER